MYHFDETVIAPFAEQNIDATDDEIQANFQQLLLAQIEQKLDHNIWGANDRAAYCLSTATYGTPS